MAKHSANVPTIHKAAGLAAKAIARMDGETKTVHEAEAAKKLQLVSAGDGLHAPITHGKVRIQIEGNDFAATTAD
jgi:hypothetical protein